MTVPALLEAGFAAAPDTVAFRDARRSLSGAAAVTATADLAQWLASRGLRAGDRVLIVSENDVATPLLILAAQSLRAWPAPMNARVGAAEFETLRACADPRLTVFAVEGSGAAAGLARTQAVERHAHPASGDLLVARAEPTPCRPASSDDVALLLFTSGTTGQAKAVMWTHAGLAELGRVLSVSRATTRGAVVQCAGPLSHIMGISNFMVALHAGATLQLMPRLEVATLADAIAAGEVTHLSLVPTAYLRLCDHLETTGRTLAGRGLRYISCGGAPLDPTLKARVERLFGLRLVNGYGMTECAPGSRTRPDVDSPADCIGWPEAGVEMRIEGGETGELVMRSATRMLGYFGQPGETAAILREDGWLATGDLARRLPDGSYQLVGRSKEMIIRSGFNVYPAEVEAVLNALPGVHQSAVVGRREADGNEEVIAFVQWLPEATRDAVALLAAAAEQLAPYKRPARIVSVDEFPLGPTGKLARRRLLERVPA